jgi:hypothetical protein
MMALVSKELHTSVILVSAMFATQPRAPLSKSRLSESVLHLVVLVYHTLSVLH